jgi:2'-hydroxyisoflavone reductase
MRLLALGGTVFLGRHLVDIAIRRGHDVTMFNRGIHNPGLYLDVERITGDRNIDLERLRGRTWDAVIDTSGMTPATVRASAVALSAAAGRYVFISSLSVYADVGVKGICEDGPVATLPDGASDEVTPETYGALKALCEQAVLEEFGQRGTIVRPGLIVGPFDPTDRFTYWPERIARGGEVLVPGTPPSPVQFIDVRDLASWTLDMAEGNRGGIFNATSPPDLFTMGDVAEECRSVSGSDAVFTWVPDEYLLQKEVGPWMELPLWIPLDGDTRGFFAISVRKALDDSLHIRPLSETVRATLDWAATQPGGEERKAGLDPAKEAEVLAGWHASKS